MEGITGPDVLKAVAGHSTKDSYRFIFMTADRTWATQADARMIGGAAFLLKPFTLAALKSTIEKVLAGQ